MVRYSRGKLAEYEIVARSQAMGFTVYRNGALYEFIRDDEDRAQAYEVTAFVRGEDLFFVQVRYNPLERVWVKEHGGIFTVLDGFPFWPMAYWTDHRLA